MNTFFSRLAGRSVDPHFGQNCKTGSPSKPFEANLFVSLETPVFPEKSRSGDQVGDSQALRERSCCPSCGENLLMDLGRKETFYLQPFRSIIVWFEAGWTFVSR